jgi:hypothetical protein
LGLQPDTPKLIDSFDPVLSKASSPAVLQTPALQSMDTSAARVMIVQYIEMIPSSQAVLQKCNGICASLISPSTLKMTWPGWQAPE